MRWVQVAVTMGIWISAVFLAAGRWNWLRGWACAAVYVITMTAAGVVLERLNPAVVEARSKLNRKETPAFDCVFLSIFVPLTFAQAVVAGLDAGRFRWAVLAPWTFALGFLLFLTSMLLIQWTLLVNPFAEASVRIQKDRGHRVISEGPYKWVRHPMYLGMLLLYPATGWMFGSGWALAVGFLLSALVLWRTAREDAYLMAELPGYSEFASGIRYRLFPGLW